MIDGQKRSFLKFQDVRAFLDSVLDEDIHTKRVDSLANATLGVMTGASLAVSMIGHALAQARGLLRKHAVKQVDRLLSNAGSLPGRCSPMGSGGGRPRKEIVVAMDWTDFDADGQATLALKLVSGHGRATPLFWLTMLKDELAGHGTTSRMRVSPACRGAARGDKATILADRGFGDPKLFDSLTKLGFAYVIRLRGNIRVGAADGKPARRPSGSVRAAGRAICARHRSPPPRNRLAPSSVSTPRP